VSDILVSIIESVVDAAASAKARRAELLSKAGPAPAYLVKRFTQDQPPQQAPAPPPKPAPVATPSPVVPEPAPGRHIALRRLFAGPDSLIRFVLGAEILGPPIALRQQNPWDTPGV
jgi:hypothetical protein